MNLLAAGSVLLADQWTKRLAMRSPSATTIPFLPVVRLRSSAHTRPHFQHVPGRVLLIALLAAALGAVLLLRSMGWFTQPMSEIGLGVAFGGAAGNLIDVIHRRAIIDFIEVGERAVFNLADVAIVTGLLVAFAANR